MLRHLKFSNFKSWPSLDMECGRITGIFGTNSSGKSSILQFLLMLKQTQQTTDQNATLELNGNYVKLGRYDDIIGINGDDKIEFYMSIAIENPSFLFLATGKKPGNVVLDINLKINLEEQSSPEIDLRYSALGASCSISRKKSQPGPQSVLITDSTGESYVATTVQSNVKSYVMPISVIGDKSEFKSSGSRFIEYVENIGVGDLPGRSITDAFLRLHAHTLFEEFLDELYYLGPIRVFPARNYIFSSSQPRDLGAAGERCVDAILYRTSLEVHEGRPDASVPFQEKIAQALKKIGLVSNFRMEEISDKASIWNALVRIHASSSEVPLTDVGFGISQVLPVITLLHYVPEKSVILLEQPELHLHPLAQANLADFIIDVARERNLQIIVESHSEQFLLRLQRRIAEEAVSSNEIRLYFVDIADGKSHLVKLDLDEFGAIHNWPKDFMGDAFGETAKAELARIKRRKHAQGK